MRSGKSHQHWTDASGTAEPPVPRRVARMQIKRYRAWLSGIPVTSAFASSTARSARSRRCRTSSRFRSRATTCSCSSGDQDRRRTARGIKGTFQSVFPIKDFNETAVLEFVKYELEPPKYDVEECMQRDMTYAAPLKVTLRLIVFEVDEETGARSVKDIKEQDVYMGDMPLMTPQRHLHRQRHRAGHRLPDAPLARASSSTTTRARPTPRASCSSPPASSPTAAPGSTSSSTPRTSSSPASTAAASCR